MTATATIQKPKLRGWLHLGMAGAVIVAGVALLFLAPTAAGRIGTAIWLAGAVTLFGVSAAYHLGSWEPATQAMLRRLDHANIFIFIAATYTPLALMLLPNPVPLLALIWTVAITGVTVRLFWQTAPRWLDVAYYLLLGWAGVGWLPEFWHEGGPVIVILIAVGGLVYSLGALVYARKRPNPWPQWFGFHEIFHACTIVAAGCHFAAITLAVLG